MPSNALRADASGKNLIRGTGSSPPKTSFTISGYFYISVDRASNSTLFDLGASAPYYLAFVRSDLKLATWQNVAEVTGSTLSVGRWYHLAMTVSGSGVGQWLVYLDGNLDITANGNAGISDSTIDLFDNQVAQWFNGRLSNVMVWKVPLNIDEIKAQRFQLSPIVRLHQLDGWYPCRNGPYEAGRDYSGRYVAGNQNHFTVAGALTDEPGPSLLLAAYLF